MRKSCLTIIGQKATNRTAFFLNRVPTKVIYGISPFKSWYGYKPHLKKKLKHLDACILFMCHRLKEISYTRKLNIASLWLRVQHLKST